LIWILGRIQTNGEDDVKNVNLIQNEMTTQKLSKDQAEESVYFDGVKNGTKSVPEVVESMNGKEFFGNLSELMNVNAPSTNDTKIIDLLSKIDIIPGQTWDQSKVGCIENFQLNSAVKLSLMYINFIKNRHNAKTNGWQMMRSGVGRYGTNYTSRFFVAKYGLAANLPDDAFYPTALEDSTGVQLNGGNKYVLHFEKNEIPPVNAFWSVTAYNKISFLVENEINRYARGSKDILAYNADGSLDIYIQNVKPSPDEFQNWLPVPVDNFSISMRLYWPQEAALDGTWSPPAIKKVSSLNLK